MATSNGQPDMTLIAELLEDIQRHPPAVAAKTLLAQHYVSIGWFDAAADYVEELKREAPSGSEVEVLEEVLQAKKGESDKDGVGVGASQHLNDPGVPRSSILIPRDSALRSKQVLGVQPPVKASANSTPKSKSKMASNSRHDLVDGYRGLRQKAKGLFDDLLHLQTQQTKLGTPQTGLSVRIQSILQGQILSGTTVPSSPPGKAQLVARAIQAHPEKAMDIAIADLEDSLSFMRGRPYSSSDDFVRDELVKRIREVEMSCPDSLKIHCELAFMHVEHENLKRRYANDTTMSLMEPVSEIPREDFYVTEDNYAWDLSELVQAIAANDGVMRNPLSREMFTPKDVQGILMSPHGKPLAPLRAAQHDMSQGVRPETIARMEKLAEVMLAEREQNQMASRKEMDHFQAYVATLPDREQKTIEAFRCPAFDTHSGKAFDSTIGKTLRDAKATEVCIHKAGDFIKQAAAHLKSKRGVSEPDRGCVVM
ncbi:hypothetical protein P171DRAFT_432864 [Karstenula rhodostoma CBS 690.94]|uniref:Uncharacterized protein n=1 Tax=Karstenula rhodostoma CBS 690.94 TaxID=1392251 RepID=A0A9P4PHX5_9PLEO|nr:hypothetical protein P171DRAFT_432864 [Karstenula rhodostoma CBS 690.94]